jgi:magnesium transporter
MIIAYVLPSEDLPKNIVWVDLFEPTLEEEKCIARCLEIDAPTREEIDKIELISPFYKEGYSYHMTVTVIHKTERDYPETIALTFILHPKCLVTLRYSRPRAFHYFSSRALRYPNLIKSPELVLEGLIEAMIHGLADVLEKAGTEIDQLLVDVFEKPNHNTIQRVRSKKSKHHEEEDDHIESHYYTNLIKKVGRTGNLISKLRESLVSFNRMMIFFAQIEDSKYLAKKEQRARFRNLSREIHSITEYANFLAQRNSFLLDAALGMINVEQNKIIKVFTVASVLFMPPTLIASIYGMNFKNMPEITLTYGYPLAIVMMIFSALLPFYLFKKKGWF